MGETNGWLAVPGGARRGAETALMPKNSDHLLLRNQLVVNRVGEFQSKGYKKFETDSLHPMRPRVCMYVCRCVCLSACV